MQHIGCHLSVSKGFYHMGKTAHAIDADTFQFFTRNPRGGQSKAIDAKDLEKFLDFAKAHAFGPILAHAPYTLNPASDKQDVLLFAHKVFSEDLEKLEQLPDVYYNFHPGSHVGQGVQKGISLITELLNEVITPNQNTIILLETMSGKGSEVGSQFEELQAIISNVHHSEKIGVCLDTCHVYDAGYDIVHALDDVIDQFDAVIGLDKLKAIHLNDSKNPFTSHKDRHEKIGQGFIGLDAIARIVNHPRLKHLPFYLETPNEMPGYAEEIALLRAISQKGQV